MSAAETLLVLGNGRTKKMNNIDLEKFIIGLSKLQLRCGFLGKINIRDAVNIALRSQNLQVNEDFKLTVLQGEPQFKVGDWIVRKDGTSFGLNNKYVAQIIDVTSTECEAKYIYWISKDKNAQEYICDYVDDFRKWTIEDANDGDVLSYQNGEWIFIFEKEGMEPITFRYHSLLSKKGIEFNNYCETTLTECIKPATKEQHNLLFQKMKEAGYEWNAVNKKLVKRQLDDIELILYDYLSNDIPCGEFSQQRMREIAINRAKEIREKLK